MAKVRYAGLDTLRGVTLVSMMAYHACWDLVYIFGMDWDWYGSFGAYLWQQSICWTFILLSGYCVQLGRHRLRRGCAKGRKCAGDLRPRRVGHHRAAGHYAGGCQGGRPAQRHAVRP